MRAPVRQGGAGFTWDTQLASMADEASSTEVVTTQSDPTILPMALSALELPRAALGSAAPRFCLRFPLRTCWAKSVPDSSQIYSGPSKLQHSLPPSPCAFCSRYPPWPPPPSMARQQLRGPSTCSISMVGLNLQRIGSKEKVNPLSCRAKAVWGCLCARVGGEHVRVPKKPPQRDREARGMQRETGKGWGNL